MKICRAVGLEWNLWYSQSKNEIWQLSVNPKSYTQSLKAVSYSLLRPNLFENNCTIADSSSKINQMRTHKMVRKTWSNQVTIESLRHRYLFCMLLLPYILAHLPDLCSLSFCPFYISIFLLVLKVVLGGLGCFYLVGLGGRTLWGTVSPIVLSPALWEIVK